MTAVIAYVIAIISTTAFLALWFWVVYRELQAKTAMVNSAESQLAACRKNHMQTRGSLKEQDAKSILARSLDIYHQSIMLFNQTLQKPGHRIPGFLMGFRLMKEGEHI